ARRSFDRREVGIVGMGDESALRGGLNAGSERADDALKIHGVWRDCSALCRKRKRIIGFRDYRGDRLHHPPRPLLPSRPTQARQALGGGGVVCGVVVGPRATRPRELSRRTIQSAAVWLTCQPGWVSPAKLS